jgi:hypothetical protein
MRLPLLSSRKASRRPIGFDDEGLSQKWAPASLQLLDDRVEVVDREAEVLEPFLPEAVVEGGHAGLRGGVGPAEDLDLRVAVAEIGQVRLTERPLLVDLEAEFSVYHRTAAAKSSTRRARWSWRRLFNALTGGADGLVVVEDMPDIVVPPCVLVEEWFAIDSCSGGMACRRRGDAPQRALWP